MARLDLAPYQEGARRSEVFRAHGRVIDLVGLTIEASGPSMSIGDMCFVEPGRGRPRIPVEVVGFRNDRLLLMPLGDTRGIAPGSLLVPAYKQRAIRVGDALLGRVINGLGEPIDNAPPPEHLQDAPLLADPPPPLARRRIVEPMATGIRAIDGCITCGKGQRIGIMSGSGVGKSKLMGMLARNSAADVIVIALVGERGREVRDFIEVDLGEEGLQRAVVVVATSDEPALLRINGAYAATAVAEYFRDQGADVLLVMDSVTRFAMAQREIGLAIGEPPTTKGYPPSVYGLLPKLLERAGQSNHGSITGFYTVLVEGDDLNDPIGDAVRSILDGHIVLSRDLASRGQYPAVDVLESVSRVMSSVVNEQHQELAVRLRQLLATYRDAEDLVNIGAYVAGGNPEIDLSLKLMPKIRAFLTQGLFEQSPFDKIESYMTETIRA